LDAPVVDGALDPPPDGAEAAGGEFWAWSLLDSFWLRAGIPPGVDAIGADIDGIARPGRFIIGRPDWFTN
jgi:hypothetical protein